MIKKTAGRYLSIFLSMVLIFAFGTSALVSGEETEETEEISVSGFNSGETLSSEEVATESETKESTEPQNTEVISSSEISDDSGDEGTTYSDEVILRAGILGDAQSLANESRGITQYRKALNMFKNMGIDVLIDVGDTSDVYDPQVWREYKNVFDTVFQNSDEQPEMLVNMGNHEYYGSSDKEEAREIFNEIFGKSSSNEHKVINGYHFINITTYDEYCLYSQETLDWLAAEIEKASAQSPGKPVFVSGHPHVQTTVYGSDCGWGNGQLYEVLQNYENVVYISGHSHFVLTDERSIHQRDFTSVGTASIQYLELEGGKLQGIHPEGVFSMSQVLYMEIYSDRVEFTRINLETGETLKDKWVIDSDLKKENFVYTDDRKYQRSAPVFPDNSSISFDNVTADEAVVTFTAAQHEDFTHSYRIRAIDTETGSVDFDNLMFSDFYLGIENMKPELSCKLFGLKYDTEYRVEISAIESFLNESEPISAVFRTNKNTAFEMEIDESGVSDISGKDAPIDCFGNPFVTSGLYESDYTLRFDGNSYVKLGIDKTEFEKISKGFAFETVFSVDELGSVQEVFGNAEMGGVCLEISSQGDLQFWAWSEDSYSYVIASEKIKPDREYHCVCTYDGNNLKLYLNGTLSDSVSMSGKTGFRDGVDFILGADPNLSGVSGSYLKGTISEFVIYKAAFDDKKAKAAYNSYVAESGKEVNSVFDLNIEQDNISDSSGFDTVLTKNGNIETYFEESLNRNVLKFDGNSCINTGMSDYQVSSISNSFTIETVFCIDDFYGTMDVFANTEMSGLGLESSSKDSIGLWIWSDSKNQYIILNNDIYAGEYYYYTAVYNGREVVVYINGEEAGRADFTGNIMNKSVDEIPFVIGADPQNGGETRSYFKGNLALMKIEKNPIDSEQVWQRYKEFEDSMEAPDQEEYRGKLEELCAQCESLDPNDYTEESYGILLEKLEEAKNVLSSEYDGEMFKLMYDALQAAFDSLEKAEDEYILGDVNKDGIITIADVTLIQQFVADKNVEIDTVLADVNLDGIVSVKDATEIQLYIAKSKVFY